MKDNFQKALEFVLHHEGGYVSHPRDPGGITNLGVTKAAYEEYLGRSVTEQEMRDLAPDDVIDFYKKKYWDVVKGDELPSGVDYAVFDFAVNSGPGRAARTLQECVGAVKDGSIGPKTLEMVSSRNAVELSRDLCDKRLEFLQGLPHFSTFAKGWTRRVLEVSKTASAMAV